MQYIFHNAYFGLLAVAERVDGRTEETNRVARFVLGVENYITRGFSLNINTIIPAAKRYITKNENKYIHTVVEYDVRDAGDIDALYYIDCAARSRAALRTLRRDFATCEPNNN